MIVEYKLNKSENGNMIVPPWVENCGHFFDPITKTYIGFVSSENNREFYVPDTVNYLTVDELKTRVRGIPMRKPFTNEFFSNAEKYEMVENVVSINDLA